MNKKSIKYLIIILVLFVGLIIIQHKKPQQLIWTPNYTLKSKQPYACYIFHDMLEELFKFQKIYNNKESFYISLRNTNENSKNLLIITQKFETDELDLNTLFDFVSDGNSAFISANLFPQLLLDTFNLEMNTEVSEFLFMLNLNMKLHRLNLTHPSLMKKDGYSFKKDLPDVYFSKYDKKSTYVLGVDEENNANYIKMKFGDGYFYLHSQPLTFTNYHLLYSDFNYAKNSLAYLPNHDIIWDGYYKPGKIINVSPLRFILSQSSLKFAFYMLLFAIVLYMLFEGKRKQRFIPVIKPYQNSSLEYLKTVSSMYITKNNNKDIAEKKFKYFNEYNHNRYNINYSELDDKFIENLSSKSGVDKETIIKIYENANFIKKQFSINSTQLIEFNKSINYYYKNSI